MCGEDIGDERAVELLVWNMWGARGQMRYQPDDHPCDFRDWQDITGHVVHVRCLPTFFGGVEAQLSVGERDVEPGD